MYGGPSFKSRNQSKGWEDEKGGNAQGGGGGGVVQWLVQKTQQGEVRSGDASAQQKPEVVTTSQGAVEWFNAQKKKQSPAPDGAPAGGAGGQSGIPLPRSKDQNIKGGGGGGGGGGGIPLPRSAQVTRVVHDAQGAPVRAEDLEKRIASRSPEPSATSPPPQTEAELLKQMLGVGQSSQQQQQQQQQPQPVMMAQMPMGVQPVMMQQQPVNYAVAVAPQMVAVLPPQQQQHQHIQGMPQDQHHHDSQPQRRGGRGGGAGGKYDRNSGGRRGGRQGGGGGGGGNYHNNMERYQEEQLRKHQEQMETNPEYRTWYAEQEELQEQQEALRSELYEHISHQQDVDVAALAPERINLPVILDLIDEHQVTFICTDTGSGKSTTVPKALLEQNSTNKIVSTQPRRTATISIANHVCKLRGGESIGEEIGYWIRGERVGDDNTRLWYMTSYTMLLHLMRSPLEPPFTHIIIDEFHERQPDIEVTVALLRMCLKRQTAKFKLIVMSATLNIEDWEKYFEGLSVAVYRQSEPEHKIHDYFMEDVCTLVGASFQPRPFHPSFVDPLVMDNNIFVAQQLIVFLNAVNKPQHSILVFLPGRAHVEVLAKWLELNLRGRLDIIQWHSQIEIHQIQAAIGRKATSRQKVYIATDIAEVSITLPDVVFVIDLALVKRPQITTGNPASVLYPPLNTHWVSRGSVAQRRGRVGRTQQGFYFCLLSKDNVEQLLDFPIPPITNSRIDELALHSLQLCSNPVAVFSICCGQPHVESIGASMRTLMDLGSIMKKSEIWARTEEVTEIVSNSAWSSHILAETAEIVDTESIEEYACTFIGRLLQLIPVSAHQGMLVFYGFLTGLESLMILTAAVTNSLSPFTLNPRDAEEDRRKLGKATAQAIGEAMAATESSMKSFEKDSASDIIVVLNAILGYKNKKKELGAHSQELQDWCNAFNLSLDRVEGIIDLELHIKNELANFVPFRDEEDPVTLATQLEKYTALVIVMTCAAFADQALEVTAFEGGRGAKEGGMGLFNQLRAMPDLHSPSCIRWHEGEIVVPINISLRYSHTLASFSTAVKSPKIYYLSLLLFSHRLRYGMFCDENGMYAEFAVTYNGITKYIEVDETTATSLLDFRRRASRLCASLRLRWSNREMMEEEFDEAVLATYGLANFASQQKELVSAVRHYFFGDPHASMIVCEVEHGEEELDHESILAFSIPAKVH